MSTATGTWTLDPTHSAVEFAVRHLMVSTVRGRFTNFDVNFEGDPNDLANAKVKVTIDASTIETHNADRDNHLRSADFFDVEKYPNITFESRSVTATGEGTYDLVGDLTIRDVTKSVTLKLEFGGVVKDPWGAQRAGFSAEGKVNRKDFGLTWNVGLEAGGVLVGDDVKLSIEVELVQQA